MNQGDEEHVAHLVRIDAGRTVEGLVEPYTDAVRTGKPRPAWMARFGGPGAAVPHSTSAVVSRYLEPGNYVWLCLATSLEGVLHFTKGMARPLVVRHAEGAPAPRTAPETNALIRLADYAFAMSTPLAVGRQTIKVENLGAEPHEVVRAKLGSGKTLADVQAYLANPAGPPPATPVGGVSALAPDLEAYIEVDLPPGDYLLLCFVSAPDGRPHIEHGMILPIEIG